MWNLEFCSFPDWPYVVRTLMMLDSGKQMFGRYIKCIFDTVFSTYDGWLGQNPLSQGAPGTSE